jgi:flagellar biosynthetic protein FliR
MMVPLFSNEAWLAGVMLLSIRISCIVVLAPPFGSSAIPVSFRILLSFFCAAFMAPAPDAVSGFDAVSEPVQAAWLVKSAVIELGLGMAMSLGLHLAFAMFSLGARLLDVQIGFGMGQVMDPLTRQQLPVLTGAFTQMALVLFFSADGHHALMRGLALSVDRFPPGSAWWNHDSALVILQQAGGLFSLGFAMVAPVVACLMLVDLTLGLLARNLPQMNVFALGVPLKVGVGLATLSVWVAVSGPVVARIESAVFSGWEVLLP